MERIIMDNYGVGQRKAKFLARQETALLMSKFHEQRYKEIGVTKYIWSTSNDGDRVRDDHKVLNNKVFFVTDADDETVDKFYSTSELFVLPSINEAEAFGIVQLEAMSRGLPVINTNLKSGVPFVSLDCVTVFTVNPMNVVELKNSILSCSLLDNSSWIFFSIFD
jgi:SPP1 gp7 family putative phage head morphogenesis protein